MIASAQGADARQPRIKALTAARRDAADVLIVDTAAGCRTRPS